MEFGAPWALALVVPVLAVAWWRHRAPKPAIAVPSTAALLSIPTTSRQRLARWRPVRRGGAAGRLPGAAARPRVGEAATRVPGEGVDIVLSLDLSSSMTSSLSDGRTRLEGTKEVVREFITNRVNDRVGLVVFQREAIPLVPPTTDYRALDELVAELEPGLLPDGTGIGVGIGAAVNMLRDSRAASRVVVLLTDGRHNARESIAPLDAAELAAQLGIPVYTIAVVDEGPRRFSDVDEELLQAIAERTGARFFAASSTAELRAVYEEIARLETSPFERERYLRYREFGPWLAAAAAALLAAWAVLDSLWLRRAP
jgi:Ca-activated chloride channel family protein